MAERKCQGHVLSANVTEPSGERLVKATHKTVKTVAEFRLKYPPDVTAENKAQLETACAGGIIALCADCNYNAKLGGHKLQEHSFADSVYSDEPAQHMRRFRQ